MKPGADGFTIIESLVALAILSVALVTLYGVGATSLRNSAHVSQMDRVILLATSKLDELNAIRSSLPEQSSGTFAGTDTHWTLTTRPVLVPGIQYPISVLQDVHLEVTWRDGLRKRSLSVDSRHVGALPQ